MVRLIKILSIFISFIIFQNAIGQVFSWSKKIGGNSYDRPNEIQLDNLGNIYLIGHFLATSDFDPSGATYNLTSTGTYDVFVAKYNSLGNILWARKFGGSSADWGISLDVDDTGNVYFTGSYSGTADLDPGAATYNLTSAGSSDIFLGKIDALGNLVWAKSIGSAQNDYPNKLKIANNGTIHLAGYTSGTIDFDPDTGITNYTTAGGKDAFIANYNSSGQLIWGKGFGGTGEDMITDFETDSLMNIYISGSFENSVDFDPSLTPHIGSSAGNLDVFFGKYDSLFNLNWIHWMGGIGDDEASCVNIYNDAFYLGGKFSYHFDFDPSVANHILISNGDNDEFDIFFTKYDPNGNYLWAKNIGGGYSDAITDIEVIDSTLFLAGSFEWQIDFDPSEAEALLLTWNSGQAFLARYDQHGNYVWGGEIGGTLSDGGLSLQLDHLNNLFFTGYFSSTADMNPSNLTNNLSSSGSSDVFFTKFSFCSSIPAPVNTTPPLSLFICYGDSINISASGIGTLSWYNAAAGGSNIGTGPNINTHALYQDAIIYVQDSTCVQSSRTPIPVVVYNAPDLDLMGNTEICLGDTLELYFNGTDNYVWSTGDTTNSISIFTTVDTTIYVNANTVNGCYDSLTIPVLVNPVPIISLTGTDTICEGQQVTLLAQGADVINWNLGVLNGIPFIPLLTNTYIVSATNPLTNCFSTDSTVVVVVECLDIYEESEASIRVFPNPAHEFVWVEFINSYHGNYKLSITNMFGQVLSPQVNIQNDPGFFDLSMFPSGVYLLKLEFDNKVVIKKIIKEN